MGRKLILMMLFIICSIHAMAQTDYYYDSYYGTKIPLILNENKVLVSVPIDCNLVMERIRANVQPIMTTETIGFFYIFITRTDLEKLTSLDTWEEDSKSVIITPCYYRDYDMEETYREVFLTPFLQVTLKKEEDIDLLTSYAEEYKLKIDGSNPYYPLVYSLHVTLESEKNALGCANEMHESGFFESSQPDFAIPVSGAYEPSDPKEDDPTGSGTAIPLVVEGRTWNLVSLIPTESPESESVPSYYKDIKGRWGRDVFGGSTYTIQGDTIMDGIAYKKLLSTNGDFCCGLREEEGRVYKRAWAWDPTGPEVLFFDFDLQPGDIIKDPADELFLLQVKQVKNVMIGGKSRRCLEMWYYEEGVEITEGLADYWIEGIGCMDGPIGSTWSFATGPQCLLLSCYDGDECIFNIEEFLASFPTGMNPTVADRTNINSDTHLYDLSGRRVQGTPKKGVYIQNGKKVVIK